MFVFVESSRCLYEFILNARVLSFELTSLFKGPREVVRVRICIIEDDVILTESIFFDRLVVNITNVYFSYRCFLKNK